MNLHRSGQFDEAESAYLELVEEQPGYVPVLHNLGALMVQSGRHDEALPVLDKALELSPSSANIHSTLGAAYIGLGRYLDAINGFGNAIKLKPDYADAHCNTGLAWQRLGEHDKAAEFFHKALEIQPSRANSLAHLGLSQIETTQYSEAITNFDKALILAPVSVLAMTGKASALRHLHQHSDALKCLDDALEISPTNSKARLNRATLNLSLGNFEQGWLDFEARLDMPGWHMALPLDMGQKWRGENLTGKTILLCTEQGMGDNIQCIRYARNLKEMGARIIVAAPPALADLFKQVSGVDQVITTTSPPAFDFWCPLFSLPLLLAERLTIPTTSYLRCPTNQGAQNEIKKIGIVWAGDPLHQDDARRSMNLRDLSPLFDRSDREFVNLQAGNRAHDPAHLDTGYISDPAEPLDNYTATAREISKLDLVISVDTSVAHLASAMGKPVWLMVAHTPDWRWQFEGERTPWYPSMKLFRQITPGDWQDVVKRIGIELDQHKAF
ncbi:MAG: glycosyltransferase family protein [Alphaproteobacteria bacterium]|nr:glycosyltransferase family protein [Alphaproteobacteria bacterium]MBT4083141.1 glycosyltransferase family protein [Alphaproteobacteria bacterium]MBT4544570.1 glycosyltransferase family protein [Alphaproteobacteria bacterium]MBT7746764.1 glycosyltransferase family protein [Alphaproteobacteria bacterium]